jgi:hydrogenase/urease accessory protein HupE
VAGAARTEAHPLSASYGRFAVRDEKLEATLRLPLDDMDLLLRLDGDLNGSVSDEELQRARPAITDYLDEKLRVAADGVALAPSLLGASIWKDSQGFPFLEARIGYAATKPIGALAIQLTALQDLYSGHRTLTELDWRGPPEQFVFQHGNRYQGERGAARLLLSARQFTLLGVEHIFTGYDHILFLLGLLLAGRGFKNLVAIVTSFTLAHSLTLALATLELLQPPSRAVEAAIALSVAYVGAENLLVKEVRHRWRITFAFGLVHGFGFASLLREMQLPRSGLALSLFTFNLGVEIGQVAIVALIWPMLLALDRTPHRVLITRVFSAVILGFGLYWLAQRLA